MIIENISGIKNVTASTMTKLFRVANIIHAIWFQSVSPKMRGVVRQARKQAAHGRKDGEIIPIVNPWKIYAIGGMRACAWNCKKKKDSWWVIMRFVFSTLFTHVHFTDQLFWFVLNREKMKMSMHHKIRTIAPFLRMNRFLNKGNHQQQLVTESWWVSIV